MAAQGHKHNDKKLSRSQRRRDTENAVFEELAELLPLSQDVNQDKLSVLRLTVAYLKLRAGLQTDEQDLEECLAAVNNTSVLPSLSPSPSPLAMLDSDGNLVAGSLDPSPTTKDPARAVLPDRVVSELEKTFLSESNNSDNTDINLLKEKFQKYKEGLETGMQEFLNQDPTHVMFESSSSSDLALGGSNIICHKSSNHVRKLTTKQGAARYSIGKENRICRTYPEHKKNTHSSLCSGETDNSLGLIHSVPEGRLSLEAASGFILSLDKDKRVLFVTENVSEFLGLCQWSVIGQDVSEFVYEKDYPELERQMNDSQFNTDGTESLHPWQVRRTFYVAMRFCFQKPGSRLKDCGFQLYQWNAKLRLYRDPPTGKVRVKGLVSLCCPLQRDAMLSAVDSANFFMVRYSFKDSRILFCDPKIQDLLGYSPSEMIGIKHSDLKHPADLVMCRFNYRNLPVDGKVESGYYRLLSRVGVWVWMYSNLSIHYNKAGEPEVLTMKNIIVSQAEAECVLSREKRDYQRIQIHGTSDIFSDGMPVSSIAALKFLRARKKRKPFLDSVYTVSASRESSSDKPHSAELTAESTPSGKLERKCVNKLAKLRDAARKQATDNGNNDKLQTEIEKSSTQAHNVDTHQCTACNTSSVSSKQQVFTTAHSDTATADSDRATEMLFFDKLVQDISAGMTPSRRVYANSATQEQSLDALLFNNSQDDIISSPSSTREASNGCSFPLQKLAGASGEANTDFLSNNDQMIQLQTNYAGQNNSDISLVHQPRTSRNPFMSTQEYSNLAMSDDLCLDNIIDFLDDDSSSDDAAFLKTSSGNVMLSSITAPEPIRSFVTVPQPNRTSFTSSQRITSSFAATQPMTPSVTVPQPITPCVTAHQPIASSVTAFQAIGSSVAALQPIRSNQENEIFLHSLNKPDFLTSETTYNNTDWLLDKLTNNVSPNVISRETLHSEISSDCPVTTGSIHVDNLGLYSSLCNAPPIISSESDIIYSPGKLDYPPFQSTRKANQVSEQFSEHCNKNNSGLTKEAVATATSCKQSIHQIRDTSTKNIAFNTCPAGTSLGFPEASMDKIQNSLDHQTQQFQEKVNSNSQVIENTLPNFSESVNHKLLLSEDICNYLVNANISAIATTDNTTSNGTSTGVTVPQDLTDSALKLPEDLLDLTDSASRLPEDLLDLELDCDWLNS
ncbi:hypothetical protein BsWGS_15195 [Bradybaena similaris]